ncbi:MAG TPA: helical backbone metal receptor [Oceanipulchritudo sp.]|nr:helical backbone metal receptor [Oceanipulchritudo sp.]
MNRNQKILTYATGFVLGCLILAVIPRDEEQPKRHPWHAQTAMEGTYPMTITDDAGRTVTLARQPRHFISLAPSVTEMLYAMEMGDHLMAVTQWCTYPAEAKALRDAGAHVGSIDQPNRETIAAYQPDLIIGTDLTPPEIYAAIENPPKTVAVVLKQNSVEDILQDISTIGRITGLPGNALRLIARLKTERAEVQARLQTHLADPPRRVLFLLSIEEGGQPGWAPGQGTWVNDLITEAHGANVASQMGQSWGEISLEALLALDPDVVLVRAAESPAEQVRLEERLRKLPLHPVWKQVKAVREGRVRVVPYGPLNIPGPRIMEAYAAVADGIWN